MDLLRDAFEKGDFLKVLEVLLKDLFKKEIIDGAVFFEGENFDAKIINDDIRISGISIKDIEGIAKSFVEKAIKEGSEIFEDDLLFQKGTKSSIWYKIKSIYVFPVFEGEKLLGILYIDRIRNENKFSEAEKLWLKFLGMTFQIYLNLSKDKKIIEDLQKEIWIGNSKASELIREKMRKFCYLSPILLLGETGTGKGLLAELLHKLSGRQGKFVVVNLPSLPEPLFEAELFGCKKGAFTEAVEREGLVGEADKGTLFFDEVSEIPKAIQAKLLRFLDNGFYKRLGEDKEKKADCKIICATNKDLSKEVEKGNFREDLFFRISTYTIEIPPLRERKEDIEEVAKYYLKRNGFSITKNSVDVLKNYPFYGNVRELQNFLNRAMAESEGNLLDFKDVGNFFGIKKENKVEFILKKIEEGENFWNAVKKNFLKKELNRDEVKEIIRRGLMKTENRRFKELLKFFNLEEKEYHRFMAFLHKYKLLDKNEKKDREI
jgi:transcriptional regulator with GAF, ATPase, and Fis domain